MLQKTFIKSLLIIIITVLLIILLLVWRWYYFGFKAAVTDVAFYGKVIDQHERPVSEARISYFIAGQFLAAGAGSGFTLSDEQGYFTIRGEGAAIVIQTITHPLIDYNSPKSESEMKSVSFSQRSSQTRIEDWEQYTIHNPYLFKAYRVNKFEDVKSGNVPTAFIPDGRIYTLDVFKKGRLYKWNKWQEGETDGILRASCERAAMADGRDYQDWRITLTPVDGGIQVTDDIYMNEAPESGYQSSFIIEQNLSSPDYQNFVNNQKYYIIANNKKYYGSLYMHYNPHFRNDECVISISYKTNLNGSRNLAVKPKEGWKP